MCEQNNPFKTIQPLLGLQILSVVPILQRNKYLWIC